MKTCQPMFYVPLNAVKSLKFAQDDNLDYLSYCDFSHSLTCIITLEYKQKGCPQ